MRQKAKRRIQKYTVLPVMAAILLTAQGIFAQTSDAAGKQAKEGELPKNPVHHCAKQNYDPDYTDWSYVCFGSYPQREVKGKALTSAVTGASYDANGDALVDGTKYRRISRDDTNYGGFFGDREYRYFKWEPIRWRVLSNDGSALFLMADKGLDCKDYNEEFISVAWEDCTLRDWLNSEFYTGAFDSGEQEAVMGRTGDKVRLLSLEEAVDPSYGFCRDDSMNSVSRSLKPSDYAHAMGAYTGCDDFAGCNYWLSSPGSTEDSAAGITCSGFVDKTGSSVHNISSAVVPVLRIDLSSDLWSLAETKTE